MDISAIIESYWPHIETFLKIVPGAILFPFSAYLIFKKVGNKATFNYTITKQLHTETNISSGVISNKKDKTIVIHDIYIRVNKDIIIEVKEFSPPLIVKALETTQIDFEDVSSYTDGEQEIDFYSLIDKSNLVEFFSNTPDGPLRLETKGTPTARSQAYKQKATLIYPIRKEFKGIIYGDNIRWAIVYKTYGMEKTAFITEYGFACLDWPYRKNQFEEKNIGGAELIKDEILSSPLKDIITEFIIYDLSKNSSEKYSPAAFHLKNIEK